MTALLAGVCRVDGPIAGLGECPANATGNAVIEYVLYASEYSS